MKLPKLEIDIAQSIKKLDDLFGIFFEDINHAVDGGLYAELIQNGSFEFCALDHPSYHGMTAWEKVKRGAEVKTMIRTGTPAFPQNIHYLQVQVIGSSGHGGLRNAGFHHGFSIKAGEAYIFSCYARAHDHYNGEIQISLQSLDGIVLAVLSLPPLTSGWQKYEITLKPHSSAEDAALLILAHGEGFFDIDMVSLMPAAAFGNLPNIFRKDIAAMLTDLKPKFMRFPGGCLVADGSPDAADRCSLYRWKNTIGPIENRPSRRNSWGYNQTLGIGFYEYFLFSEAIGAEPIPVLPVCKINGHSVPMDELQELIQDAIDLISFANDEANTEWGAKRAELGHPEPFHLKYLALGNEEVGETFFSLYPYFHREIKKHYPEIKLVNSGSPFAAGTEYDRGWASARKNNSEFVDEHYYQAPEWFLANMDRYDHFDPKGPMVFLGEYASWSNTYYSALVEAAYMTHLEKAPAVGLACYAPLLCNADYINWKPDLIWFNQKQVYGTANYYVQKLFMNHQGTDELSVIARDFPHVDEPEEAYLCGDIVFDSKKGRCKITEIKLEYPNQSIGCADQMIDMDHPQILFPDVNTDSYTLSFKACKTEMSTDNPHPGNASFTVLFGHQDSKNTFRWDIGGWANNDSIVGHNINGRSSCLHHTVFSVEIGRVYDCKLVVKGRKVETWIDGQWMNKAAAKMPIIQPLYYAASKDDNTGEIIIKAVNVSDKDMDVEIVLDGLTGGGIDSISGTLYCLAGYLPDDENSFEEPEKMKPYEIFVAYQKSSFVHRFPACSVNVFRLQKDHPA